MKRVSKTVAVVSTVAFFSACTQEEMYLFSQTEPNIFNQTEPGAGSNIATSIEENPFLWIGGAILLLMLLSGGGGSSHSYPSYPY